MTKTINALTVTTSAASGDFVPIWRAANNDTRKITKANLIGAVFTGGGTIATGGYTLTVGGTSAINGTMTGNLSALGFTLTVPATGTASLLGVAQTYTALKTFSGGLNLGQALNFSYFDGGNWTPQVADAATAGNVATSGSVLGIYQRMGTTVFISGWIADINTTGLTAGNDLFVRGLPFTSLSGASNYYAVGTLNMNRATFASGYLTPYMGTNRTYMNIAKNITAADAANLKVSEISSGLADINFNMTYFCVP